MAASLAVLGGCGSSSSTSAPDPATDVPAAAQVYADAEVRAQGSRATEAVAAGRKLTHMNQPYLGLLGALLTPGSAQLSYGRDVAPWLGRRAGLYLSSSAAANALLPIIEAGLLGTGGASAPPFASGRLEGALVLDTTDTGKAKAFLERQAGRAGAHAGSYRGVAYQVTSTGLAFGMVGPFAVIGSEAGLHGVVDTHLGASSLARSPQYAGLAARAPSQAIAHIFSVPSSEGLNTSSPGLLGVLMGARLSYVSLVANGSEATLFSDTQTAPAAEAARASAPGLLSGAGEAAAALQQLPGESWLAVGLGRLGASFATDIVGLRELAGLLGGGESGSAPAGAVNIKGLIGGLLGPLASLAGRTPQARAQAARWMGTGGVFASGTGLLELKAAVVIESRQPALSRAAVGTLGAELRRSGDVVQPASIPGTDAAIGVRVPGLPVILDIVDGTRSDGHAALVLGLGEASVAQALHPSSTMASSSTQASAAAALGEGIPPNLILQTPTLVALLEGIGLAEDPNVAKALGYLRAVGPVYGGGHSLGGGGERFKLAISLQ